MSFGALLWQLSAVDSIFKYKLSLGPAKQATLPKIGQLSIKYLCFDHNGGTQKHDIRINNQDDNVDPFQPKC